jgi:hypothetical protein
MICPFPKVTAAIAHPVVTGNLKRTERAFLGVLSQRPDVAFASKKTQLALDTSIIGVTSDQAVFGWRNSNRSP